MRTGNWAKDLDKDGCINCLPRNWCLGFSLDFLLKIGQLVEVRTDIFML
jgi:hypothetical protein